jgi:hypothetical protein
LRFIVRLVGDRHLTVRGRSRSALRLARGVRLRFAETVVRESSGGEKKHHLQNGFRTVKLPRYPQVNLTLVVVSSFRPELLMLLTNLEVKATRRSVGRVVQGYLSRWLVEETTRFIKQSYPLEDLRVLHDERLRNLAALVMTTARRFLGVPEFHDYALADGIGFVLSHLCLGQPDVVSHPTRSLDAGFFASPINRGKSN